MKHSTPWRRPMRRTVDVRLIGLLALLLLPVEARPLGGAVLQLTESRIIGWGQSRRGRGVLVGLLLLVLTALPSLAYASPPDPSWIPGLYDDADYDDVVVLVTAGVALMDPDLLLDLRPILLLVAHAPTGPGRIEDGRPASVVRPRAPPAS